MGNFLFFDILCLMFRLLDFLKERKGSGTVFLNTRVATWKWVGVQFGWVADCSSLHLQKLNHFCCDLMFMVRLIVDCGLTVFFITLYTPVRSCETVAR